MAKLYALCALLLFHVSVSFAQIEQVVNPQWEYGSKTFPAKRLQVNSCQLHRINAVEPSRRVESEAGVTEIWDENDNQFECAGVVPFRHRIQSRGLLLPSYSNGPKLIYVEQGRGLHSVAVPGCPETYQSFEQEGEFGKKDQHQKIRQVKEGDVVAVPAGMADWFYNDGQNELVLFMIIDTSNTANQLDDNFRKFFLAGSPPAELQSLKGGRFQRGERSSRRESWRGLEQNGNIFSGIDENILAEVFNIDIDLARRMKSETDNRGIIVNVQEGLEFLSPHHSREEDYPRRHYNGLEETLCSARWVQNIDNPSRADVYSPRSGRITNVNSGNLPILKFLGLSAQKGVLYKRAIMSPHWNMNAHSICYFVRGSGQVQIVADDGRKVFDGHVKAGQVLTAPQNFVIVKMAGSEGLEWVSFKTNDNAKINQLAGRVSALRALPDTILANAYQISREDARKIKFNREEVTLLSPQRSSTYRTE